MPLEAVSVLGIECKDNIEMVMKIRDEWGVKVNIAAPRMSQEAVLKEFGYLAAFKPFADHEISEEYRKYIRHEVKKFRAVPEITHRHWKELGLMKPLEPEQTAQYKFSDLQMSLYYTIYI